MAASATRSRAAAPTCSAAGLVAGRWQVDGSRSALQVSVKVGLFATAHGRFHEVTGHVDVATDHLASTVEISVATASLSSGSACMDTLLHGAGIIDSDGCWLLDGLLTTDGAVLDVTLRMSDPALGADGALTLTAVGELTSKDAVRLLSRPGVEKMLGRTMALDLTVVVVPA
jgi:hypothetical protein